MQLSSKVRQDGKNGIAAIFLIAGVVALVDNEVAGWAALTTVSGRCVYAGVGEVSVYVAEKFRGQKIGNALLQELVKQSESNNIWTLQAGIFPENVASIKVHAANGFRTVGYREKIGQMDGVWRDTVLMERRSPVVGVKLLIAAFRTAT